MKNKMKVMMVTPYYLTGIGGLENYVKHISAGLTKKYGVEVFIVTTNTTDNHYAEEEIAGTKIYRLPILFKISNSPFHPLWSLYIKKIISKEKPNIINAHIPVPFLADFSAFSSGKTPFFLTYHAGFTPLGRGLIIDLLSKTYENLYLKFLLRRTTRLISSSKFVASTVLKDYHEKTQTITPGVDTSLFKISKRAPKDKTVLFVGTLKKAEKYKGLDILIVAMAEVIKKHEGAKLTVVGDGDNIDFYKKLCIQMRINKNVIFKGKMSGTKLAREYQETTIYAHPSTFDSCPLTVLEAMASGKPVIGSSISGIPHMITDKKNGSLFPPGDAQSLAKSIIQILENPGMGAKMGKEGIRTINSKYTWDIQVQKTYDFFYQTLSEK